MALHGQTWGHCKYLEFYKEVYVALLSCGMFILKKTSKSQEEKRDPHPTVS